MAQKCIAWTPTMLAEFKEAYHKAKDAGKRTFIFEGNEFLLDFAKYLIEYLSAQFGVKQS